MAALGESEGDVTMKRNLLISVFLVVLLLSACVAPATTSTPTITPTPTPAPTPTPTPTPAPPNLTAEQADWIVIDAISPNIPTSGFSFQTEFNPLNRQWHVTILETLSPPITLPNGQIARQSQWGHVYIVDDDTGKVLNPQTNPATPTLPLTPSPTAPPTSTPAPTTTPTPTMIMCERPASSPMLTSSNWVVSYCEKTGELPVIPNSLLPMFHNVEVGDKLPLNAGFSIPSKQFWNGLLPSERQTMLDIVEWYGTPAEDYLWLIGAMIPGTGGLDIQVQWVR